MVKRAAPRPGRRPGPRGRASGSSSAPSASRPRARRRRTAKIGDLLGRPAEFAGRTVRVVGRFRGRNLEHDLPEPGPALRLGPQVRPPRHLGHRPQAVRPRLLAPARPASEDTGKWLEVTGRVETWKGVTHAARQRGRAHRPGRERDARAAAADRREAGGGLHPARRRRRARAPDDGLPRPVQHLHGRGELRGAGCGCATGTRPSRRASCAAPAGGTTRPGGPWSWTRARPCARAPRVELLLLPGIDDAWGTPLPPEPGAAADRVLALLRWQVEG